MTNIQWCIDNAGVLSIKSFADNFGLTNKEQANTRYSNILQSEQLSTLANVAELKAAFSTWKDSSLEADYWRGKSMSESRKETEAGLTKNEGNSSIDTRPDTSTPTITEAPTSSTDHNSSSADMQLHLDHGQLNEEKGIIDLTCTDVEEQFEDVNGEDRASDYSEELSDDDLMEYDLTLQDTSYSTIDDNERRKTKDIHGSVFQEKLVVKEKDSWFVKQGEKLVNMTNILNNYRTRSLKENKKDHKAISSTRALSLNCVYLNTIRDQLKPYIKEKLHVMFERSQGFEALLVQVLIWSKTVDNILNNETRDEFILEKALLGFKTQALVNEDTLVHYILHSPLHWIFAADNRLEYQWANASLDYCKGKKGEQKQPNFTVYAEVKRRRYDLFVVEVKRVGELEGSDLVKTGNMLREMLSKLVIGKVPNPVVFGMVMNGYNCTTYKLQLNHAYVFELIELKKFDLPSQPHNFKQIDNAVEGLNQIKYTLVLQMKEKIVKRYKDHEGNNITFTKIPDSFIPPNAESIPKSSGKRKLKTNKNNESSTSQ
ncbi:hypothetical protein BDC45DRAFT_569173 [Circinella umbellata]|nr:hypothetical protein BDC45DRAFT_569173 [Circinella umbellata]